MDKRVAIVVPTLNAGDKWKRWVVALQKQKLDQIEVLLIDSESEDCTVVIAESAGMRCLSIERNSFNHGKTRQIGVELFAKKDIVIFLTQDAILIDKSSIGTILGCFNDDAIGAAYGRQLPHNNARPLGAHARLFNYPETSMVKGEADIERYGVKTAFISNSFAAYRVSALMEVGGFPGNVILGEDTYVAAKMILSGWKVAYCAEAAVYHSHDYSIKQEFQRYFDIGVFHARESWIGKNFGKAEGEGKRFVLSEWKYLWETGYFYLLPSAIVRTIVKYLGYRLGKIEALLPVSWKRRFSMHKGYWEKGEK